MSLSYGACSTSAVFNLKGGDSVWWHLPEGCWLFWNSYKTKIHFLCLRSLEGGSSHRIGIGWAAGSLACWPGALKGPVAKLRLRRPKGRSAMTLQRWRSWRQPSKRKTPGTAVSKHSLLWPFPSPFSLSSLWSALSRQSLVVRLFFCQFPLLLYISFLLL